MDAGPGMGRATLGLLAVNVTFPIDPPLNEVKLGFAVLNPSELGTAMMLRRLARSGVEGNKGILGSIQESGAP